ncbi:hypothetical protein [Leptospira brenneri]|nr:hypothetical protein [Leptospira brenneri]
MNENFPRATCAELAEEPIAAEILSGWRTNFNIKNPSRKIGAKSGIA